MSFFVNGNPVAVSDAAGNTVWVLARMGIGVEARVFADFAKFGADEIHAYRLAILRHNIVRWEGPDFTDADGKPVPCTHANIDRLNVDIPLIAAVREKIGELNRKRTLPVSDEEESADPTPAVADI